MLQRAATSLVLASVSVVHSSMCPILLLLLLILLLLLLLLLAVPTLLWGRCGRHNSPPDSSVVDILLRCSDGSHVRFHTVYPSLLWSSSSSSPRRCHLQRSSSHIFLFSSLYMSKPPQSRFHALVCDRLYLHSLLDVLISHMVS